MDERYVKILVEIPIDGSDQVEIESLWAVPVAKGNRIDNIPFYAKGIALNDVVRTEERDGIFYFQEVAERSGHSTIRIWFDNEDNVQATREELKVMGCPSELSDNSRLLAVDVPPDVPYEKVKDFLEKGEIVGKWDYQEACLGYL